MTIFIVQIAETRNYEIVVDAPNTVTAGKVAMKKWRDAPEVGGFEIPDTTTKIVAISPQRGEE